MMEESNEPFCSHCGYQLTGLVDSSKCPECGRPLVEVLVRGAHGRRSGKRYTSRIHVFGLPLVHIATGPYGSERIGRAKGIIAIGDTARGVVAFGGSAIGVFAFGGFAAGLFSFGGLSIGLLGCIGGLAVGGLTGGGGAIGVVAMGGVTVGVIADGGMAIGYLARGGEVYGTHRIGRVASTSRANQLANQWSWLIGTRPGSLILMLWILGFAVGFGILTGLAILTGYGFGWGREPPEESTFG